MPFALNHADEVRDIITGFRGVIIGRCDYITGCNQYLVQPGLDKDAKFVESRWVDEDRLLVIDRKIFSRPTSASGLPGADKPAPRR
jgi:hypothetical protein